MRVMVTVRGTTEEAQAIKEIIAMTLEELGPTRIEAVEAGQSGWNCEVLARLQAVWELAGVVKELFRPGIEAKAIQSVEVMDDGYGRQQAMF